MHLVRFVLHPDRHAGSAVAAASRRFREPAATAHPSTATVPLVSTPAVAVIAVRARIVCYSPSPSVSLPCSKPLVLPVTFQPNSNAAAGIDWNAAYRDTLLKVASRQLFIEISGVKIRAFLADAEFFHTLCSRP